jgi:hypothetical protein
MPKEPQPEELLALMQTLHKRHGKKDNRKA